MTQKDPLRASVSPTRQDHSKDMKPVLDHVATPCPKPHPSRPARARGLLVAKVALLACSLLVVSWAVVFAFSSIPAKTQSYIPHAPISIIGDGGFTPENGVVSGTGGPASPYIISGWEISVDLDNGIYVEYTTAHFVILGVHVNGTATPSGSVTGIYFSEVTNGKIANCLINDTNRAVDARYSSECSVYGNQFLDTAGYAMNIEWCTRLQVVGNQFDGQNGIQAYRWENSRVLLNEFLGVETCVSGSDIITLVVKENTAIGCDSPLSLLWSTNVEVFNNLYIDCLHGITFNHVTYAEIRGNVIERAFATAIDIRSSSYNITIKDNLVNGTGTLGAIVVEDSWTMAMTRNTLSNNTNSGAFTGGGITLLTGCSDVLIFSNNLVDNMPQQAEDRNGAAIRWNGTYPVGGNYWSDYSGVDQKSGPGQDIPSDPDGFGDDPYEIDGDSWSYYPLMAPVPLTVRPVAGVTAFPSPGDVTMVITFDGSSSSHPNPAKNITGFRWDFNGDGFFETSYSSDPVGTKLYTQPGNYTVILEIEDEDGMTDMTTLVIDIYPPGIIPEFGTLLVPVLVVMVIVLAAFRRRSPPQ